MNLRTLQPFMSCQNGNSIADVAKVPVDAHVPTLESLRPDVRESFQNVQSTTVRLSQQIQPDFQKVIFVVCRTGLAI